MTEPLPTQLGPVTVGALQEAIRTLRKATRGALLVSSGQMDVRLVIEPRAVGVEAAGVEVEGDDDRDLIRSFLNCVFWDEATFFLDPRGTAIPSAAAIRLETSQQVVLNQIEQGLGELSKLRSAVPGMDASVVVSGDPPPDAIDTPAANLFRVLQGSGGGHLGTAAEQAGLDAIDAAWAVFDLVGGAQAMIKPAPSAVALRRLKHAERLADEGLLPALRYLHLARGLHRLEPQRAARLYQGAADGFLVGGFPELALGAYRSAQELAPEGIAALEGQINALEALKRGGDARRAREQLIERYFAWFMPGRARRHLEALPNPSLEERERLLNAQLLVGDFAAASDLSTRLLPELDRAGRVTLVRRFVESGATGADLARAEALAGIHTLRPVRRLLLVVALLGFLAAGVLGAEVYARQLYQQAAFRTQAALQRGDVAGLLVPWQELNGIAQRVGSELPLTCLSRVPGVIAELERIQADHALLTDPTQRAALAWKDGERWDDVRQADAALTTLHATAKSAALQALAAREREALAGYRAQVATEVKRFRNVANRSKQLVQGQKLIKEHHAARDLFADLSVPVLVKVSPVDRSTEVTWEVVGREPARLVESLDPEGGSFEVRLPLDRDAKGLLVVGVRDHVRQQHVIRLMDLVIPEVSVELYMSVPLNDLRATKPSVRAEPGLHVLDVFQEFERLQRDLQQIFGALEPAKIMDSTHDLAHLRDELGPGQRLIVQVVSEGGVGGQAYLERFRLWLDEPLRGREATPYSLILSRKPISFGLSRPVQKDTATGFVVEPIRNVDNWRRVREALSETLANMRKELEAR